MFEEGCSEGRAWGMIGQPKPRSTQRKIPKLRDDEEALRTEIVILTSIYGHYTYRWIAALLGRDGWQVNHKRVERIWHQEGLKVPEKPPKWGRLWLNDGFCVRLKPTNRNHVLSYDFMVDRTHDGRTIKILKFIDEYTQRSGHRCRPEDQIR